MSAIDRKILLFALFVRINGDRLQRSASSRHIRSTLDATGYICQRAEK